MSVETIRRITTAEGNVYELPSADAPQLWEVAMQVRCMTVHGQPADRVRSSTTIVHVERQTLVEAGVLPMKEDDKKQGVEKKETAEDLLLRLLAHVDVYPE